MSDIVKQKRQLKIKTGVVKRLWKEHSLYRQEEEDLQVKYDKFLAQGDAEEWDLKNTNNMKQESHKMVFDIQKRLTEAVAELREIVIHAKTHPDLFEGSDELNKAEEALYEANL